MVTGNRDKMRWEKTEGNPRRECKSDQDFICGGGAKAVVYPAIGRPGPSFVRRAWAPGQPGGRHKGLKRVNGGSDFAEVLSFYLAARSAPNLRGPDVPCCDRS